MNLQDAPSPSVAKRAGIGLRSPHVAKVLAQSPAAGWFTGGWFEVHAENYMNFGPPLAALERIRERYPVSLHAVGLSLGTAEGIDLDHLRRLKELAARIEPVLISDHLSCSSIGGAYLNDLLPLPYTEESLALFAAHVDRVQSELGREILIENPSAYLQYRHSAMSETEFLGALVSRTGCKLICDVNNIYVSAKNLGYDAKDYLAAFPRSAVGEIHLAGHFHNVEEGVLIDDHGSLVSEEVWDLYADAVALFPDAPALIEWDSNIPDFHVLMTEAERADDIARHRRMACATCPAPMPPRPAEHSVPSRAMEVRGSTKSQRLGDWQLGLRAALIDSDEGAITSAVDGGSGNASSRVQIYRNNMVSSLTEALKAVYPALVALVDARFFSYAAHEFIRAHPPVSPVLSDYGAELGDFLARFEPCKDHPYLPDIARLEWRMHRAALAPANLPLGVESLIGIDPSDYANLIFRFDPPVSYLESRFPIDRIWRAAQPGANETVDLGSGPAYLEIRREDERPVFQPLDAASYRFRMALNAGKTLSAAVQDARETDVLFDLAAALGAALRDGLFAHFTIAAQRMKETVS